MKWIPPSKNQWIYISVILVGGVIALINFTAKRTEVINSETYFFVDALTRICYLVGGIGACLSFRKVAK
jgi:hypothetical protein